MNAVSVKNYEDTFLYGKNADKYEKNIFKFLMSSREISKSDNNFADLVYDVKRRQVTSNLVTVLNSPKTVLLLNETPLPKALKVFFSADLRSRDREQKVFIDVSEIYNVDGTTCKNVDILIAHLVSAMQNMIYYKMPGSLFNNTTYLEAATSCFVDLFSYVLDYLRPSGYSAKKASIAYYIALYFQFSLMDKDPRSPTITRIAQNISGLSAKDANILNAIIDDLDMKDIDTFVHFIAEFLKEEKLNTSVIVDKWLWLLGTGTQFALEMLPAFSTMLTNAYCGVYLNNQKNIEKNAKDLVAYNRALFKVGSDLIK